MQDVSNGGLPSFDKRELSEVESFRREKNTSVLTVMFTDIKNFTLLTERKGDEYANALRKTHDGILVAAVQEHGDGRVLKHIGDSVMAIFSEPSAAVRCALRIQERLQAFNADPANPDKLLVRIGLHMGQVTVEENLSTDVFGRVVNRASRIEALADGGHVYASYTVLDSAKSWLQSAAGAAYGWKLHGQYYVKGVDEALAVYEIYDKAKVAPQAPAGGRKKRGVPALAWLALVALLGAAAAFGFARYEKTTVEFRNIHLNTKLMMEGRKEIVLGGNVEDELRPAVTGLAKGPHVVYYDVSNVVRYYAPIEIKRGRNVVETYFTYDQMPGISRSLLYEKNGKNLEEGSETSKYTVYDGLNKKEVEAVISVAIKARRDEADKKKVLFDYDVTLTLDGKEAARKHFTADNAGTQAEARSVTQTIYEDAFHYYYAKYYISGDSTQFDVSGSFIEYKDK